MLPQPSGLECVRFRNEGYIGRFKIWSMFRLWTLSITLLLFKTRNVSETGFCLRLPVELTQMGPIDTANPYLQTLAPESVKVTLRLAVYLQFVLAPSPLGPTTSIFFFQLNTCGHNPYVTTSLTRRWVCRLQFLLALANAVTLGSESRGTHGHILLSPIRNSSNVEDQVPVLTSLQEHGTPVITPYTGFPFRRLRWHAGLRWRYSNPLPHGLPTSTRISIRVTLRMVVYRQSVRLGAKPLDTHDQWFFQLNPCGHSPYATSSLTRGWVYRLQLLLAIASAHHHQTQVTTYKPSTA
jgi:hypothetical protein